MVDIVNLDLNAFKNNKNPKLKKTHINTSTKLTLDSILKNNSDKPKLKESCANLSCTNFNNTSSQEVVSFLEVKLKNCGKCFSTTYCSRKCQLEDWPVHKTICKKMAVVHQNTVECGKKFGIEKSQIPNLFESIPKDIMTKGLQQITEKERTSKVFVYVSDKKEGYIPEKDFWKELIPDYYYDVLKINPCKRIVIVYNEQTGSYAANMMCNCENGCIK